MKLTNAAASLGKNSGFTVVEMIIALTLLTTAAIPLAALLSTGLKTTVKTGNHMYARQLAANEIDRIKGLDFEAVGITTGTATFIPALDGQDIMPETGYGTGTVPMENITTYSGNTYTVTRDIHKKVNPHSANAATKEVIITVSWTDPQPAGSVQLSTLLGMTDMPPS